MQDYITELYAERIKMFGDFHQKWDTLPAPVDMWEGKELGSWLQLQRIRAGKGLLAPNQIKALSHFDEWNSSVDPRDARRAEPRTKDYTHFQSLTDRVRVGGKTPFQYAWPRYDAMYLAESFGIVCIEDVVDVPLRKFQGIYDTLGMQEQALLEEVFITAYLLRYNISERQLRLLAYALSNKPNKYDTYFRSNLGKYPHREETIKFLFDTANVFDFDTAWEVGLEYMIPEDAFHEKHEGAYLLSAFDAYYAHGAAPSEISKLFDCTIEVAGHLIPKANAYFWSHENCERMHETAIRHIGKEVNAETEVRVAAMDIYKHIGEGHTALFVSER